MGETTRKGKWERLHVRVNRTIAKQEKEVSGGVKMGGGRVGYEREEE